MSLPSARFFLNPHQEDDRGLFSEDEYARVDAFFDARSDMPPTPLHELPGLAAKLGLGRLLVKDESSRLGLNAFKGVGVLYAVTRMLEAGRISGAATLVCATQGNHGRAVAHVARRLGLRSRVYVPANAVHTRVDALRSEGADVVRAGGGYDDAVASMRADAEANGWTIVSDTAWPGYEEIPRCIMCGYTRIMSEFAKQAKGDRPDVVIVQAGVGGLAAAVASWLQARWRARPTASAKAPARLRQGFGVVSPELEERRRTSLAEARFARRRTPSATSGGREVRLRPDSTKTSLVICEPLAAPCLMETARAGELVTVSEGDTIMAGLCAGRPSSCAWRLILSTADAFVAIDDSWAERGIALLAKPVANDPRLIAGGSGAAGLGALLAILEKSGFERMRATVGVDGSTKVLLINTEGATDPSLWDRVVSAR